VRQERGREQIGRGGLGTADWWSSATCVARERGSAAQGGAQPDMQQGQSAARRVVGAGKEGENGPAEVGHCRREHGQEEGRG
jgi:hypothetical protein